MLEIDAFVADDWERRFAAVQAADASLAREVAERLGDVELAVRAAASVRLEELGVAGAAAAAALAAREGAPVAIRRAAAVLVGRVRWAGQGDALVALAQDADALARSTAQRALAALTGDLAHLDVAPREALRLASPARRIDEDAEIRASTDWQQRHAAVARVAADALAPTWPALGLGRPFWPESRRTLGAPGLAELPAELRQQLEVTRIVDSVGGRLVCVATYGKLHAGECGISAVMGTPDPNYDGALRASRARLLYVKSLDAALERKNPHVEKELQNQLEHLWEAMIARRCGESLDESTEEASRLVFENVYENRQYLESALEQDARLRHAGDACWENAAVLLGQLNVPDTYWSALGCPVPTSDEGRKRALRAARCRAHNMAAAVAQRDPTARCSCAHPAALLRPRIQNVRGMDAEKQQRRIADALAPLREERVARRHRNKWLLSAEVLKAYRGAVQNGRYHFAVNEVVLLGMALDLSLVVHAVDTVADPPRVTQEWSTGLDDGPRMHVVLAEKHFERAFPAEEWARATEEKRENPRILTEFARDPHPEVRAAAGRALLALDSSGEHTRKVASLVLDDDAGVRAAAARALARSGTADHREALRGAMRLLQPAELGDVRQVLARLPAREACEEARVSATKAELAASFALRPSASLALRAL